MRQRASMAALVLLGLLLSGCEQDAAADTLNTRPPAATAGRACQVVEYDVVATALGTQFDTAGGAQAGDTYTCVLGVRGQPYPDFMFAMSPTTVSQLLFSVTVPPPGSTAVDQLGVSAYQVVLGAQTAADGTASGPVLEVCWLSAGGLMLVLRYTFAATAVQADIDAIAVGLVTLGRQVDGALSKN